MLSMRRKRTAESSLSASLTRMLCIILAYPGMPADWLCTPSYMNKRDKVGCWRELTPVA